MDMYTSFASLYDSFMEETPYAKWVAFIERVWKENIENVSLVLDLGCGTGTVTEILAQKGYEMIGVDLSEDMLMVARQKASEKSLDILYLNQDMREFELYGTVDACVCLCDSINYITDEKDVLKVFELVNNYLNPGGIFIFDINTAYKFKNILSDNTFAETGDNGAYIWENYYDEDEKVNEYYINFFTEEQESGLYERFEEVHIQKAYTVDNLKQMLKDTGFKVMGIFDEENFGMAHDKSQKLFFAARNIRPKKMSL